MNKKIIFYFLTALVVLTFKPDSSYSAISKYNDNVNLDFWTPKKTKKVKPLTNRQDPVFPIGRLFAQDSNGELGLCTASVINVPENGNIGLTAAHCIYDPTNNEYFKNIMFSPGYDNEQNGPLGLIPVEAMIVPREFITNNNDEFDWGLIRFTFNRTGHPLQDFTGSLTVKLFDVGNRVQTSIRGYPDEGFLEGCPNESLCTWEGEAFLAPDYYIIHDLDLGEGASGAPLIMNYNQNTNTGFLYSNYGSYDELNDQGIGPIYNPIQFQGLLGSITGLGDIL
ncbi:1657_t:CDS:1 [Cetraspora pellucida]|uniref:1657_t:CDS:1 n=1 Tax=Cetraspora pellucida TaxID=1433469 RepID=A0ACA9LMC6_9GLOM|nr:1657_t:CDS:1 [Cetraspora pellucida]